MGAEGYYGVYTVNAHTDTGLIPESTTTVAVRAGARSARRHRAPDADLARRPQQLLVRRPRLDSAGTLTFTVTAGPGANGLQGMLPRRSGSLVLATLRRGTHRVAYEPRSIKGVEYALFPATAGSYIATYAADTTAPTITRAHARGGRHGCRPDRRRHRRPSARRDSATVNTEHVRADDRQWRGRSRYGHLRRSDAHGDASAEQSAGRPATPTPPPCAAVRPIRE